MRILLLCLVSVLAGNLANSGALRAETISAALALAYGENPDINQQRAATRAADEGVSKARAGYRPTVAGTGSYGFNNIREIDSGITTKGNSLPLSAGLTVTQTLYNGNRVNNGVSQAQAQVFQSREQIRNTEENVLQKGAAAYMAVMRDTAILDLNKNNIKVLEEQLRQTKVRLEAGDVTATDVAQANASLETARSNFFTAKANLQTSIATYRQIIGKEPGRLEPARPIDGLLPRNVQAAVNIAIQEHPAIQAALHNADAARIQVKLNEGLLFPTLNVVGNVQQNNQYAGSPQNRLFNASLLGQLSVPIYSGGDTYASIRQAKELLTQALFQADLQRDQVRAAVISAWGQYEAAKATVQSSEAAVKAAETALNGVRGEASVGQRTTLDVLVAQQTLLNARVNLVTAQSNRVTTSYDVKAATGELTAAQIGLPVTSYLPTVHYNLVKDKWAGLRTPE